MKKSIDFAERAIRLVFLGRREVTGRAGVGGDGVGGDLKAV